MITFDLACSAGHRFEGWFGSREDFDDQVGRGLLCCPVCGSPSVEKLLSAVAVHVGRRTRPAEKVEEAVPATATGPVPNLRALAAFVESQFEDVGDRFAHEARRIAKNEVESRNIRGTTTEAEEENLREEGVEFLKLALPKYDA